MQNLPQGLPFKKFDVLALNLHPQNTNNLKNRKTRERDGDILVELKNAEQRVWPPEGLKISFSRKSPVGDIHLSFPP